MGMNLLCHSNREWEGGGWQATPSTCISSEEGGRGGCESPPSLKSRVGGWLLVNCEWEDASAARNQSAEMVNVWHHHQRRWVLPL